MPKFAIGQRVIVRQDCLLYEILAGHYGHITNIFLPDGNTLLREPIYDLQVIGRVGGPMAELIAKVPEANPYPFFEMELEAAD